MTPIEMSYEFDIIYNNIMSDIAPGLNEYEKSIFLTKAQEQIVMALYRGNDVKGGVDTNEEQSMALKNLIKEESIPINAKSSYISMSNDVMYVIREEASLADKCKSTAIVKPIPHDHYNIIKKNPFRGLPANYVIRTRLNVRTFIESSKDIESYRYIYIKRPYPIILEDLEEGLSINGHRVPLSNESVSELNHESQKAIIDLAVALAKATWKQ